MQPEGFENFEPVLKAQKYFSERATKDYRAFTSFTKQKLATLYFQELFASL